ncbi:hypothetical protein DICSQDRAFT_175135 [Dichomitus squalens LYAD-421 SS1]|uniref:Uncharacterized protein n=2 Tax=Dichomitus squalens TaxID=114155 RepID=A0A4Q9M9Z0_9APHY|nr:uncharacterized protein DICSQDRAFT_175135 [Dichomitus squalens LYAD-421 SS1]EJF56198.1 hypothetical protein DICSQDRAFT_175135 [Dichomitus squalens LYAD-421 SS1]TBU22506.1 hypothetical protein BD311DRAFT_675963 [Dichomitus squalens]
MAMKRHRLACALHMLSSYGTPQPHPVASDAQTWFDAVTRALAPAYRSTVLKASM